MQQTKKQSTCDKQSWCDDDVRPPCELSALLLLLLFENGGDGNSPLVIIWNIFNKLHFYEEQWNSTSKAFHNSEMPSLSICPQLYWSHRWRQCSECTFDSFSKEGHQPEVQNHYLCMENRSQRIFWCNLMTLLTLLLTLLILLLLAMEKKQDFVRLSVWWQKCGNNWRPAWNLAAMNIFEYLQKWRRIFATMFI